MGAERLLSAWEREAHKKNQFEGMEDLLWNPEFLEEYKDSLKD